MTTSSAEPPKTYDDANRKRMVRAWRNIGAIVPGLVLCFVVSGAAFSARLAPGMASFSQMILAIMIGSALNNIVGTPSWARQGVAFAQRRLLRTAIVLLGLQLTAAQVIEVGGRGFGIIAATLLATFAFTVWLGRLFRIDYRLARLIAAGTSICGASAVIATNMVTGAKDEDVTYAIACVTVFGTLAMFVFPLTPGLLGLDPHAFGLWAGASIHEIAQVMAAAFQEGQQAGESATVAKLSRVLLLAPMVLALGLVATTKADQFSSGVNGEPARPPIPLFVLGFVSLVAINSLISIPLEARGWIASVTTGLLTTALAAMGLETSMSKLAAKGIRPALLGALSFVFVACFSLTLVKLTG